MSPVDDGIAADQTTDTNFIDRIGSKSDTPATGIVAATKSIFAYLKQLVTKSIVTSESAGAFITGRAVTAVLYVSPNGDDTDGSSWTKAYTTIQGALAVASADADDLTLIMIGPHATNYDINTTGDPTYTGNYCLKGSHRNWAKIKNEHASATSIMKFTGRVCLEDITFDCGGAGTTINGVIISGSGTKGSRIRHTYFEAEHVDGAHTGLLIEGGTEYIRLDDVMFHGVQANTTGLIMDDVKFSHLNGVQFHDCLTGLQITNADSDENTFNDLLFHENTLGLDLDAGNGQIFDNIHFFKCTERIDDEVGDASWKEIIGEFDITKYPDNFTGIEVATGAGTAWTGAPVEIRSAATATVPFRVIGYVLEASASEKFDVKFTADGGTTYFSIAPFEGVATGVNTKSGGAPSGTGFIFNKGTAIGAIARCESGGEEVDVWLLVQEI
jgi:hypothetical protein